MKPDIFTRLADSQGKIPGLLTVVAGREPPQMFRHVSVLVFKNVPLKITKIECLKSWGQLGKPNLNFKNVAAQTARGC